jgi:hypothetical protein
VEARVRDIVVATASEMALTGRLWSNWIRALNEIVTAASVGATEGLLVGVSLGIREGCLVGKEVGADVRRQEVPSIMFGLKPSRHTQR